MSFFSKLTFGLKKSSSKLSSGISNIFMRKKIDEQTLEELDELLITADLGIKTSQKIINELRKNKLGSEENVKEALSEIIIKILKPCELPFIPSPLRGEGQGRGENIHPYIILMVGVNGAGKTTTIGKLASKFKAEGKKISLIAADTFRAAAVEQLKEWGNRSQIRVFFGKPGTDAAGLCFDGINEAIAQKDDIVFIDTAGRLQNKSHLMEELKKVVKVIKKTIPNAPHSTLLTLDATTGQNALEQVKVFKQMVDISGLVITKLDGTSKGGILVAIADEHQTPIHYIGIGEGIDDLDTFKADEFTKSLLNI